MDKIIITIINRHIIFMKPQTVEPNEVRNRRKKKIYVLNVALKPFFMVVNLLVNFKEIEALMDG